jgi:hypothetical protein
VGIPTESWTALGAATDGKPSQWRGGGGDGRREGRERTESAKAARWGHNKGSRVYGLTREAGYGSGADARARGLHVGVERVSSGARATLRGVRVYRKELLLKYMAIYLFKPTPRGNAAPATSLQGSPETHYRAPQSELRSRMGN